MDTEDGAVEGNGGTFEVARTSDGGVAVADGVTEDGFKGMDDESGATENAEELDVREDGAARGADVGSVLI